MKIEHAAVYVRDLEGTRAFFQTYFGAVSGPCIKIRPRGFPPTS